jgi:catechol 2,3-dioxygenase-like lactoylglutathione lyase family enzyme
VKGVFEHIQYNVSKPAETQSFYRDLLAYFEMQTLHDGDGMLGMSDGHIGIWLLPTPEASRALGLNRDAGGLNHIGIHVDSAADVDRFETEFMKPRGIQAAFETPRARPEFGPTYYQVMFVDPDGVAIEVFHAHSANAAEANK